MVTFELPDGRLAYVDPKAVTCVYDQGPMSRIDPVTCRLVTEDVSCVIAIGQTNLVVPYTATRALEILNGR